MKRRKFIRDSSIAGLSLGVLGACASIEKKDCEVLILGAGLSGLYTAMLLEDQGIDYKIIEGSSRIGGRIFSKMIEGVPVDFGGVEVGDGYKRINGVSDRLNVARKSPDRSSGDWLLHYKGESTTSSKWADLGTNPLSGASRKLPPFYLESSPLRGKIPFDGLSDWYSKDHTTLDISHAEYLKKNAGYSDIELGLIDHSANHNGVADISVLHNMRSSVYRTGGGSTSTVHFTNGSESLAQAMSKAITNKPLLNKKVKAISDNSRTVKVTCSDGSVYNSASVICTIPFSVLKNIELDISTNENQARAINNLDYTSITQVIFTANKKFWEDDGLPLYMWTDTPIERVFSVNSDDETLPKVFKCFINGQGAKAFDRLDASVQKSLVKKTLAAVRPSTEGHIDVVDTHSWGNYEYNKGAYAEFHAGQVMDFVPHMAKPAGNVFFAGEHTAFVEKGMEGAMESAERAVNELIELRKTT